jgi:hypothetical protein
MWRVGRQRELGPEHADEALGLRTARRFAHSNGPGDIGKGRRRGGMRIQISFESRFSGVVEDEALERLQESLIEACGRTVDGELKSF